MNKGINQELEQCDKIDLSSIQRIQGGCALFAVSIVDQSVSHMSENLNGFHPLFAHVVLGQPSLDLPSPLKGPLTPYLQQPGMVDTQPLIDIPESALRMRLFNSRDNHVVVECYSKYNASLTHTQLGKLMHGLHFDLGHLQICTKWCERLLNTFGLSRACIYQFDPKGHGKVIAEAKTGDTRSLLGLTFPDKDVPQNSKDAMAKHARRAINNIHLEDVHILRGNKQDELDMTTCDIRAAVKIHREYLTKVGTVSNMSFMIKMNDEIWGLCICHSTKQTICSIDSFIELSNNIEVFSDTLAKAIVFEQEQNLREAESQIEVLFKHFHSFSDPMAFLQVHLRDIQKIFGCNAVFVHKHGEFLQFGRELESESDRELLVTAFQGKFEPSYFNSTPSAWHTSSELSQIACAVLFIPLQDAQLFLCLTSRKFEINWAGQPQHLKDDPKGLSRTNFQPWKQYVHRPQFFWTKQHIKVADYFMQCFSTKNQIKLQQSSYNGLISWQVDLESQLILLNKQELNTDTKEHLSFVQFINKYQGITHLDWVALLANPKAFSLLLKNVEGGNTRCYFMSSSEMTDLNVVRKGIMIDISNVQGELNSEPSTLTSEAFSLADILAVRLDENGYIEDISGPLNRFTQKQKGEVLQTTWWDFWSSDQSLVASELLRNAKTHASQTSVCDLYSLDQNRTKSWVKCCCQFDKKMRCYHLVCSDISEQRNTQLQLKEININTNIMQECAELSYAEILVTSGKIKLSEKSKQLLMASGLDSELSIESFLSLFSSIDSQTLAQIIDQFIIKQTSFSTVVYLNNNVTAIKLDARHHLQVRADTEKLFITLQDVTEQQEKLKMLHQLAKVAETTNAHVIIADTNGNVTWCNDAFYQFTGFDKDFVIGKKPKDFLQYPDTEEDALSRMQETLAKREPIFISCKNQKKDGTVFFNQFDINPMYDDRQNFIGFVSVQTDITSIHKRSQLLAKSQKQEALNNLVKGISHELNNTLNILTGNLEMLELSYPTEGGNPNLVGAQNAIERSIILNRNLRNIQNDNVSERKTLFNVSEVTRNVVNWLSSSIKSVENIQIGHYEEDLFLFADAKNFEESLVNLLTNSAESSDNPEIHLSLQKSYVATPIISNVTGGALSSGYSVELSITDNGKGMVNDIIPKICDPFFTTKDPALHAGLGLTTVQNFLQQVNGIMYIDSKHESTCISLLIPLAKEAQKKEPPIVFMDH